MTAAAPPRQPRALRVPHAGWRVIAAKELGDHLLSLRFIVLLVVLGLAAAIPLYFAADIIRGAASQASGTPAIFLALFTIGSQDYTFLRVDSFVAIVAPLLGLAFAFDAINGERADGTLPRLLAQPIYRDDVINGKFAAGLSVIGIVLLAVIGIIAGYGIFRLGITPAGEEIVRLAAWILVTFVYVGLWLAFGLLLSVVVRRAATSALIGFGVWFLLTIFGGLSCRSSQGPCSPSPARRSRNSSGRPRRSSSSPDCCRASSIRRSPASFSTRGTTPRRSCRVRSARRSRHSSRSRPCSISTRACCWSCPRSSSWWR